MKPNPKTKPHFNTQKNPKNPRNRLRNRKLKNPQQNEPTFSPTAKAGFSKNKP
jgi:hypothetical protein